MIYINENTTNVLIPKVDNVSVAYKLVFENQITHFIWEQMVADTGNSTMYEFNITSSKQYFENGQYDYYVKKANGDVLTSGILQYGDFASDKDGYDSEMNIIQYNPEGTIPPQPSRTIEIFENGEYDVENYDKAIVNVEAPAPPAPVVESKLELTDFFVAKEPKLIKPYDWFPEEVPIVDCFIITNTNDIDKLLENIDLNVTMFKYKGFQKCKLSDEEESFLNSKNRFVLVNDKVKQDERVKLYCWTYKTSGPEIYFYYTLENYNDSVEELLSNNPYCYIRRCDEGNCYNDLEYDDVNLINQLYFADEIGEYGDEDSLHRYEKGDLCSYVNVNNFDDWETEDKANKIFDIIEYSMRFRKDDNRFITYCGQFPIMPFKLGECEIKLKDSTWKKLNELTDEDKPNVINLILRMPYSANHIYLRWFGRGNYVRGDIWGFNRFDPQENKALKISGFPGGNIQTGGQYSNHTLHLYFTLMSDDEIKHIRRSSHSMINRSIVFNDISGRFKSR